MSNKANREYLKTIKIGYINTKKREKKSILSHAQQVTGLSRKRIIRILNSTQSELKICKAGRKPSYSPDVLEHLKALWFLMEQPCGKKLKVLIPNLLPSYHKRISNLTEDLEKQLLSMSPATIDRFLKLIRVQRGLSTTRAPSSSWYKSAIPVQAKDWNITAPGYAQSDTVSHCGESPAGKFASTLTVTDIDSHWTEMRAVFTKRQKGMVHALRDIEHNLPFPLHTIKFDSGSEFMNFEVISFLRSFGPSCNRAQPIQVLRSRPYRKNDNCYVEQKNLTHVRQFIGYDRIESKAATEILDELYRNYWCPFLNFFMPTFKLIRKERVGSKIKKKYETPKTPFERLLQSSVLSKEQKARLTKTYESLDPFELKLLIEEKLKLFYKTIRCDEKLDRSLNHAA